MRVADWVGDQDVIPYPEADLEGNGEECRAFGGG